MRVSRTFGYTGTEFTTLLAHRLYRADIRGILYSPGRGGFDLNFLVPPYYEGNVYLSDEGLWPIGWPMMSFASGTTWGNDTIQARIEALRSYMGTTYGATVDEVHIVSGSMGALNALNYARANPTKVRSIALQVPLTDLIDFHDRNVGGWATEIETAYGGLAAWNTAKSAHNPQDHLSEYASLYSGGMGMKVWYSTDDPYILPAKAQAFASAVGCPIQSMGAVAHNPPDYAPINEEIRAFLASYE
jgi:pimeloyl-ACP methyl ester carboxylesterase